MNELGSRAAIACALGPWLCVPGFPPGCHISYVIWPAPPAAVKGVFLPGSSLPVPAARGTTSLTFFTGSIAAEPGLQFALAVLYHALSIMRGLDEIGVFFVENGVKSGIEALFCHYTPFI